MADERKKSRVARMGSICLIVALIAYPLSIGPYMAFVVHYGPAPEWAKVFYRPIVEAAKYPVVGKALAVYVNICIPGPFEVTYDPTHGVVITRR